MAHAFSEKALKSYEEDMIRQIGLFCQKLRESEGPVNVANWCSYLTADVLGELCFGKSFGMLESEENRFVMKTMLDSARLAFIVCLFSPFPTWCSSQENPISSMVQD